MNVSHMRMIIRILIRNRRTTLINSLGLVLGLTAFVIVFSWIRAEFSMDRFHRHKDRIFHLAIRFPDGLLDANTPYALVPDMMNAFPEICNYTRIVRLSSQLNSSFDFFPEDPDNEPVYETHVARVDSGFFSMFSYETLHGDAHSGILRPDGVLLGQDLAKRYFGETNPVGRQIMMNGSELLEVTGVIAFPGNTQMDYDLYLPAPAGLDESWTWRDPSFIQLHEGVDKRAFMKKIAPFLKETIPMPLPGDYQLQIIPITKSNLAFFGKKREFLMFSGIAVLILIIAAINYMNLSTANYTRRIREMGMRKIMGAVPGILRKQLLAETLIQTTLAMVTALFLAEILLPKLSALFNGQVNLGYRENPVILVGALVLILLFSALSALYPMMVLTRGNPSSILRDTFIKGKGRSQVLLATTIFQFTVSLCLLISTLVVMKQVQYARRIPSGLDVDNVIKVHLNPQIGNRLDAFFDELESHPGILGTTAGSANPINEDQKTGIEWTGKDPESLALFRYSICLPDFPDFFGHEIIQGRLFSDTVIADLNRYMVNETACEILEKDIPVGSRVNMWGREGEIVGVFRNYHHISAHSEILPHIISIHPSNYRALRYMFIRIDPRYSDQVLDFIREAFREFSGDFPFSYEYLLDEVDHMYARDTRLARILGAFALLALLISCLGIFGLARFSAEKKARDLTIRRVFGASFVTIIRLANTEMLLRIGMAVIVAVPLSWFLMEKWLRSFAYRTDLSWGFFVLGILIGFGITILATMAGIWRSIRKEPTEILRQI